MYTPNVTVYLVVSLQKVSYIYRVYINMVLANPGHNGAYTRL
jgi:hypothetical protein